jgi:Rod binding protein
MGSAVGQFGAADQATTLALDAFMRRGGSSKRLSDETAVKAVDPGQGATAPTDTELREIVGEFVGNVFYGTLLRQMDQSTLKGKYMHGGRGEEIFQSQLHMEYAKRLGRAPGDPIADRIYESMTRGRRAAEKRTNAADSSVTEATHLEPSKFKATNRSVSTQ